MHEPSGPDHHAGDVILIRKSGHLAILVMTGTSGAPSDAVTIARAATKRLA
jgi:hypothetical protein